MLMGARVLLLVAFVVIFSWGVWMLTLLSAGGVHS